MNEPLETALNDEVRFLDEEAAALFSELGIIDKFEGAVPNEAAKQVIFFTRHLTHWIIAVHRTGNLGSEKHKFEAICFPKMKVSLVAFQSLAVKILDTPQEAVVQQEDPPPKSAETGADTLPLF